MSIVSNNIKYLRRLNGLTQEQFARRIGIKRSLLGAYEEARANPNLENLKMIAQVFGTSVDSLIKTDIRKIRETPGISLGQSTTGIMPSSNHYNAALKSPAPSRFTQHHTEPQLINQIVEDYFSSPEEEEDVAPPIVRPTNIAPPRPIFVQPEPASIPPVVEKKIVHNDEPPAAKMETITVFSGENAIALVKRTGVKDYLSNYQKGDYVKKLPKFSLPFIQHENARGFEMGEDFPMKNSIVIGTALNDWAEMQDGKFYVLVTMQEGVIYRRVYNQVKIKGTLLLSSDNSSIPSFEISIKEVAEFWEVKAFISQQLPEPHISLERVKTLVDDLSKELDRLK